MKKWTSHFPARQWHNLNLRSLQLWCRSGWKDWWGRTGRRVFKCRLFWSRVGYFVVLWGLGLRRQSSLQKCNRSCHLHSCPGRRLPGLLCSAARAAGKWWPVRPLGVCRVESGSVRIGTIRSPPRLSLPNFLAFSRPFPEYFFLPSPSAIMMSWTFPQSTPYHLSTHSS